MSDWCGGVAQVAGNAGKVGDLPCSVEPVGAGAVARARGSNAYKTDCLHFATDEQLDAWCSVDCLHDD